MYCFPARWTKTLAAAAILTLPLAASAQTPDTKVDAAASKLHLSAARDTLSQLTALPEAARIQGDARAQVSQVITSFNDLITTQADWRAAYAKVDSALTTLLGPETPDQPAAAAGVAGAVGTSGTTVGLDPAVRAKLVEFRGHLKDFERAAGGVAVNPANPPAPAAPPASAPAAPEASAAASTSPASALDQAKLTEHLDAIAAILSQSKTGALTSAQGAAVKKHVAELRALLNQSR